MGKTIMYERIYQELLKEIKEKKYLPGDKLPSEKELAQAYEVSRITTKKAMELLAEKHYIERCPGRGSFVNERIDDILEADKESEIKQMSKEYQGRMIGVIFDSFGSDFGSELLRSIEQECRRQTYDMMFKCSYGSIEEENKAINSALGVGVEGLILMCAQGEVYNSTILRLALNGFPMVLVDRQMKGISIPCVKTDNYSAAHELTEILIGNGHKKMCFVSHASMNTPTINERYNGFVDSIMEYKDVKGIFAKIEGYNPAPEDVGKEYKEFDFAEMKHLIEQNMDCTAFLAAEYKMGVLLSRALKEMGLEKEIAAFDGLESVYDEENKFVHAMQNEHEMGRCAVAVLRDLFKGEKREGNINIPYEIIRRK
ncbi:MAG: GntR family transcriptional regulator, arabinose operon transcriptional repressor [Clostridiales bacterium]|nr:GntR family transcriptional regulator, arabinose operon transcriptional repressor [Clostridiales bacterium]